MEIFYPARTRAVIFRRDGIVAQGSDGTQKPGREMMQRIRQAEEAGEQQLARAREADRRVREEAREHADGKVEEAGAHAREQAARHVQQAVAGAQEEARKREEAALRERKGFEKRARGNWAGALAFLEERIRDSWASQN